MDFQNFNKYFLKAFTELNVEPLHLLDPESIYSDLDKDQIIEEMNREFIKIRSKGITKMEAQPSKCKFCYPEGTAWSFHNPDTVEFIIRYVFYQEEEKTFIVEECRNKELVSLKDDQPF